LTTGKGCLGMFFSPVAALHPHHLKPAYPITSYMNEEKKKKGLKFATRLYLSRSSSRLSLKRCCSAKKPHFILAIRYRRQPVHVHSSQQRPRIWVSICKRSIYVSFDEIFPILIAANSQPLILETDQSEKSQRVAEEGFELSALCQRRPFHCWVLKNSFRETLCYKSSESRRIKDSYSTATVRFQLQCRSRSPRKQHQSVRVKR
jgi:hypothetical protein